MLVGNYTDIEQAAQILKNVDLIKIQLTVQPGSMTIYKKAKKLKRIDFIILLG